jgi:hypothetical protein
MKYNRRLELGGQWLGSGGEFLEAQNLQRESTKGLPSIGIYQRATKFREGFKRGFTH